jgi:hypothetical protein
VRSLTTKLKGGSMEKQDQNGLIFQHLVDMPKFECVFCSTREAASGRSRLFLIFSDKRRIYMRNGLRETWDELTDEQDYNRIRTAFNQVILERRVPCFQANK